MRTFVIPELLIWVTFILFLALLGFIAWLAYKFWLYKRLDTIIFIDKDNRYEILKTKVRDSETFLYRGKEYIIDEESIILNRHGKALIIWSVNKPSPLKLKYNNLGWLTADTLKSLINNKQIQQMVTPSNSTKDMLILLGAIGGIIAGISSAIILLIQAGVIKVG